MTDSVNRTNTRNPLKLMSLPYATSGLLFVAVMRGVKGVDSKLLTSTTRQLP